MILSEMWNLLSEEEPEEGSSVLFCNSRGVKLCRKYNPKEPDIQYEWKDLTHWIYLEEPKFKKVTG